MPETKLSALLRATREGFPRSSVVKSREGQYFISPKGISSDNAKRAYADLRSEGNNQEKSAKIAWYIEKKNRNK